MTMPRWNKAKAQLKKWIYRNFVAAVFFYSIIIVTKHKTYSFLDKLSVFFFEVAVPKTPRHPRISCWYLFPERLVLLTLLCTGAVSFTLLFIVYVSYRDSLYFVESYSFSLFSCGENLIRQAFIFQPKNIFHRELN